MAVDDIQHLREHLPKVFDEHQLPAEWDVEWIFVPVADPEALLPEPELWESVVPDFESTRVGLVSQREVPWPGLTPELPPTVGGFAGAPVVGASGSPYPPPDALAFYLPFHFYYPTWWGVYLTLEGTIELSRFIWSLSVGALTWHESLLAAQVFLYGHEAYHHKVEAFATRLEITHREPLYRKGFSELYKREIDQDASVEEALATAHGYQKAMATVKKDTIKRAHLSAALSRYIMGCPPSYASGLQLVTPRDFNSAQCDFAEDNHREALSRPDKDASVWHAFPHAFTGISRINSRVNYVVHQSSPLASRLGLNVRYIGYRELVRKLKKLAGCEWVRNGGNHEIWQRPDGQSFPVPRHPRDLADGTLRTILREAGIAMSLREFASAKA